ncbi:hypothetical protein F5B19DRAFT_112302 [Rostrohypoxylon terebratum]|nr:hypothetical protein F5B19DRAFT_112302 [Rostrohypoxylon terebratum]
MVDSSLEESNENGSAEIRGSSAKRGSSRPSFTDYWKRTKEAARSITFVSSGPEAQAGPSKDGNDNGNANNGQESDLNKAKARRAQVRKAQIQHRERKANYTKQLEMDVVRLRDLIEQTERQSAAIRTENETIRRRLNLGPALAPGAGPALEFPLSQPEYTVSLFSASDSVNSPLYQVQRMPTPSSSSARSVGGGEFVDASGLPGSVLGISMTQEQVDHAINFILGLEHICWDHFHPSYYNHNEYDPEGKENGHMLMASALALRSAPTEAWELIAAEKERRRQADPNAAGSCSAGAGASGAPIPPAPAPTATAPTYDPNYLNPNANTTLTSWPLPPPANHQSPNPHHVESYTQTTNTSTSITSLPPPITPNPTTEPALTLESLYNLATTLNPASCPELAPVQAWFEIARLYGGAVALNAALMDRVRAELAPSVDCLHFGAVISRAAFEGAVERVLGPIPGAAF